VTVTGDELMEALARMPAHERCQQVVVLDPEDGYEIKVTGVKFWPSSRSNYGGLRSYASIEIETD
jgi:hypothetical protein